MKCPQCQHENPTGAKFCEECATPLTRTCRNCGRQLSPMAKSCPECSHPTSVAPTAPPGPRFALAVATGLGLRPLAAHCQLGLGRLRRRLGDADGARQHLAAAAPLYRAMEMEWRLGETAAELAALG